MHVYRLEDGKAVEHRVGRDDLGAMRQLGVIPDGLPGPPGLLPKKGREDERHREL